MNKEILRLAIPNIISNISVPLLSTVDTALMGRLSQEHIGAVGLASMIFNFIYWNFGFLRMGTTGLTAQSFGGGNKEEISNILGRALVITIGIALLILIFQQPLIRIGIQLMNVPESQIEMVRTYFNIRVWAAPASMGLYSLLGWYFGMQNALYPLWITLFINFLNIALSYLLIVWFGMDVDGVAYGTLIAQYAGLLIAFLLMLLKYKTYLSFDIVKILQLDALKKFLNVNGNIFIRTVCLTFSFAFFYSQSAKQGVTLLAVNVILLQLLNWLSYAIDGFAFASESLVGKYLGANDQNNLQKSIIYSFAWGSGLAIFFSAMYGFGGTTLFQIFTDQESVIVAGKSFIIWMGLLPLLAFSSYIWDGIFVGLTASIAMRNSMLVSLFIFLASYYIFQDLEIGLWLSFSIFLFSRGIIQTLYFVRYRYNLR